MTRSADEETDATFRDIVTPNPQPHHTLDLPWLQPRHKAESNPSRVFTPYLASPLTIVGTLAPIMTSRTVAFSAAVARLRWANAQRDQQRQLWRCGLELYLFQRVNVRGGPSFSYRDHRNPNRLRLLVAEAVAKAEEEATAWARVELTDVWRVKLQLRA